MALKNCAGKRRKRQPSNNCSSARGLLGHRHTTGPADRALNVHVAIADGLATLYTKRPRVSTQINTSALNRIAGLLRPVLYEKAPAEKS